ncbi:hypothetical protein NGA_0720000 [Nannochloropsis gaditana CCMP526]|nr:hypothetical protein NGA_0720000 [Nannochloropsis gaditana CCMP526]EKU23155.1 hypothetical protein NGA_0720000 [Nannochloropsis gaditana CCMP526]|eukprot:XP_005852677.1 hypothetical protein NGA_0720000 [Nannochloropsis gaditana CCMP526]
MSTLSPPISALIAWTVICGTVIVLTNIAKVTKYIDKDNAGIAVVFTITAGICTFILWLVTWMQQWHPLLTPTLPAKE